MRIGDDTFHLFLLLGVFVNICKNRYFFIYVLYKCIVNSKQIREERTIFLRFCLWRFMSLSSKGSTLKVVSRVSSYHSSRVFVEFIVLIFNHHHHSPMYCRRDFFYFILLILHDRCAVFWPTLYRNSLFMSLECHISLSSRE